MHPNPLFARMRAAGLAATLSCALGALPLALAHDQHRGHQTDAKAVKAQNARVTLTETPLVDQDGRSLRFKTDAVGERIVVLGFIYTTCTTVCPVTSQLMLQTKARLGARVGQDVGLITVTVDPVRDTPARLKEYAGQLGAGEGWSWLTGPKPQVDEVLKVFGAYSANFLDHPPLVVVGDAKSGRWLRFYGFPNPDQVVKAVEDLSAQRAKVGHAGHAGHPG